MNAIGQPISRADGRLKVTGRAAYTADIPLADAAHAAMVHSTIANGRTVSIDTSDRREGAGRVGGLHTSQHAAHESDAQAMESSSSARPGLPSAAGRQNSLCRPTDRPGRRDDSRPGHACRDAGRASSMQAERAVFFSRETAKEAVDPPQFLWPVASSVGDADEGHSRGRPLGSSRPTRRRIATTIRWSRTRRWRPGMRTAR